MSYCTFLGQNTSFPAYKPLLGGFKVNAGQSHFPSPAQDYEERDLDLTTQLITNPNATFLFEAVGDSMKDIGIYPKSILVVDRSVDARSGDIVVVDLEGEWMVKTLYKRNGLTKLISHNDIYPPIIIGEGQTLTIFGRVNYVINKT